jgi:hypothetical protein
MKGWLFAVAILVGGAASFSYADYAIIRAVLGGNRQDPNNPNAPAPPGGPGAPRGPGGPGGPRGPGGPPQDPSGNIPGAGQMGDVDTAALAVQAVVAFKHKPGDQMNYVETKWTTPGTGHNSRLFNDNTNLIVRFYNLQSLHVIFDAKKRNAFKGDRKNIWELAEWALSHGLYDDFANLMDGLVGSKEEDNANNPQELKDAIKAYIAIKAALDKPTEGESRANFWRTRLSARMETSKHYAVIYTSENANPPEIQGRLTALENHMRAFYYWFALRGHALPVPADKLVAVMLDTPEEFKLQRAVLEDEPLVSDGFYAHRDHICIFSSQRLDAPFQLFERQAQPLWRGAYERSQLLDGTAKRKISQTSPGDFARLMTMALLEKALEDEGERAAVSHEGSRQLFVATGLVPRTVVMPRWAEFGSAATFETPKGPFPGAPITASVAIFPGVAAPSWAYLRPFKETIKSIEGQPNYSSSELLKNVITDGAFNRVVSAADRQGLWRARTTAWAAAYYLLKARLPGMLRYYQELSALPRDLEFDDKALLACFARAFDVANVTQDGIDPVKFEQFAKDWISYIMSLPTPAAELNLEREMTNTPQNPGAPGTPGAPGGGNAPGRPGGR